MESFTLKRKQALLWLAMMFAMPVAHAAIPPTESPFASTPGNLVNTQTTVVNNSVKPNVMLMIDNSGSMNNGVPGTGKTRMTVVQEALIQTLDVYDLTSSTFDISQNPDRIEMNWNAILLNTPGGGDLRTVSGGTPLMSSFGTANQMKRYFTYRMSSNSATPSTRMYLAAVRHLYESMEYQCQKNFIVILSDGDAYEGGRTASRGEDYFNRLVYSQYSLLPQELQNILNWSVSESTYTYDGSREDQGISRFSKLLQANDLRTSGVDVEGNPWDGDQTIQTYGVGFSAGMSSKGRDYLRQAARSDDGKEAYFIAGSDDLVQAFQEIFQAIAESSGNIAKETISTATPAAMSADIDGLAANLSLDTGKWSSQLRFNRLDSAGIPLTDSKGANLYYPADYSNRRVLVNNGNNRYWLDQTNASNYYADFGFTASQRSEFQNAFIPWLTRSSSVTDAQIKSAAERIAAGGTTLLVDEYRVRTDSATDSARMMGDVLNTNVLAAGDYVVTGANDGMLYIFRKTARTTQPYSLVLNYLPVGMPRESVDETLGKALPTIARSDYGQGTNPHIYGINGGLRYVKTPKTAGRAQQTVLLATMGEGGRGAFALRLAGCDSTLLATQGCSSVGLDALESSWQQSVPLWESDKNANNTLGYTISMPSIYPVSLYQLSQGARPQSGISLAGFVANGFRSNNQSLAYDESPTLYIYDMMGEDFSYAAPVSANGAGDLIAKIPTSGSRGALSSPVIVDLDNDGTADLAYAGDYNGDLYRFDLRGDVGDWYAVKIYDGSSDQPITAQPAIYNLGDDRVIVLVGTGSDLFPDDRFNTDGQLYMGIYDDLSEKDPEAATLSAMLEQTVTTQGNRRKVSNHQLMTGHRGWYIRLAEGGASSSIANGITTDIVSGSEKSVTQGAILIKTVYFTTRIYRSVSTTADASANTAPTCEAVVTSSDSSTGQSWLMGVNVLNGGMPSVSNSGSEFADDADSAGTLYDNILSGVVIFSNSLLKEGLSAIDSSGMVRSGEVPELDTSKTGTAVAAQDCVNQNDYRILISQSDPDQGLITRGVNAAQCGGGRLIRLNFREVINN